MGALPDSHKGVCLTSKSSAVDSRGWRVAFDYMPAIPPVPVPLRFNADGGDDAARLMSLVKTTRWSYESEYRILGNPAMDWGYDMDGRYVSFPPELLTAITLGRRIRAEDRDLVLNFARNRNPPLAVCQHVER